MDRMFGWRAGAFRSARRRVVCWELTRTVLTGLCPYTQEGDVAGGGYPMIGEQGCRRRSGNGVSSAFFG